MRWRRPTSLRDRARYRFDTTLARSTRMLVGWLVLSCLAVVVPVSALVVWTDPDSPRSLSGRLLAVGRTSAETLRLGAPSGAPVRVALSLLLGLVTLLCVSTLVGVITTGLGERLTELRRGRSMVLEQEHAVVLGWSDQVFTVVGELVAARAGRRCVIAVLADRDVAEMEEALALSLGRGPGVRLVCRSGSLTTVDTLALVTPRAASSVLVLPSDAPDADSEVVRTLLALRAVLGEDPGPPVVAAVRDRRHLPAARLAAGARGTIVETDATAARLLVHSARRSGVGEVLRDLLDFAGAEFHFVDVPPDDRQADGRETRADRCFGDVLLRFERASVVGLMPPDGPPVLNPPARTVIGPQDRLVVIAHDCTADASVDCRAHVDLTAVAVPRPGHARPVRVLLLGWNRRAPLLVQALRHSVVPGSVLDVVAEGAQSVPAPDHACSPEDAAQLAVTHRGGESPHPESLEDLDLFGYDSVIVLGADAGAGPGHPDDRVLVTLLTLRSVELRYGRTLPVVAELGDHRNRALAPLGPASDIVVRGELTGLLMAQIAHNPHLAAVFGELFAAHGASIHLRPAGHYVVPGGEASFATVVAAALDRGECAIGYRRTGPAAGAGGPGNDRRHELRLNPAKSERRVWGAQDEVVVLATDTAVSDAPHDPAGTAPAMPHARGGDSPLPGVPDHL
ncbi:voltage-gated potassium channel Kch [Streptomyces sp. V3I8]|uniref:CASTOR/POLLUX-related putative ion channel n=1 Tax=Streptomyces sp. V3I8 TaxID=3042279 RepID=UPI002781E4DC|nr:NAD-binding lipoprotein [Streptomyces sp. V3I8]MDQ1041265.1 voltage-gated potassium channel Kch [Streptomyces sp. V3I8]